MMILRCWHEGSSLSVSRPDCALRFVGLVDVVVLVCLLARCIPCPDACNLDSSASLLPFSERRPMCGEMRIVSMVANQLYDHPASLGLRPRSYGKADVLCFGLQRPLLVMPARRARQVFGVLRDKNIV